MSKSISDKGTLVASFEDNLKNFALVTKDNKINVYDTAAGSLRVQCSSSLPTSTKQFNNRYTCVAWGKNVKTTKAERGGANDIVVGTHSGTIQIWDLQTSEMVVALGEKGEGHIGAVNGLALHAQGNSGVALFSCGADGQVIQWDLKNKSVSTKWKASTTAVTRLAVHIGSDLVATADSTIKVWNLSSQKSLIKFSSQSVTSLQFTPDGEFLLSSGNSRVIKMWSCKQTDISADNKTAIREFSCDSVPLAIRVNKKKTPKGSYHFLTISEAGILSVFDTSSVTKGVAPASCVARVETSSNETNGTGTRGEGTTSVIHTLLDAHFYDTKELAIVLGPEASPSFQRIAYSNDSGLLKKITISSHRTTADNPTIKQTTSKSKTTILTAASIPPPNVVEGKKRLKTDRSIANLDAKKIASVEQIARDANEADSRVVTFQSTLEQAIHTNDKQLLNKCFSIGNQEMVKSTLFKLAPSFIIPLVKLMINALHGEIHHQALFTYLHIIISHHTALLMSSGALRECSALYSAINARSAMYLDLLKAKGRIDLFLSHLDQAQAVVVVDTNAKNVYKDVKEVEASESDESEESDAEMAENDEEEDEVANGKTADSQSEDEDEDADEDSGKAQNAEEDSQLNGKTSDQESPKKRKRGNDDDDSESSGEVSDVEEEDDSG